MYQVDKKEAEHLPMRTCGCAEMPEQTTWKEELCICSWFQRSSPLWCRGCGIGAVDLMVDRKQRLESLESLEIQTQGHTLSGLLPPTRSHPLLLLETPNISILWKASTEHMSPGGTLCAQLHGHLTHLIVHVVWTGSIFPSVFSPGTELSMLQISGPY